MKCKQFVKVYSRAAAIIEYEVPDWEKLYWFLRYLIPDLHVDSTGEDIKDLLDAVDLSWKSISLNENYREALYLQGFSITKHFVIPLGFKPKTFRTGNKR